MGGGTSTQQSASTAPARPARGARRGCGCRPHSRGSRSPSEAEGGGEAEGGEEAIAARRTSSSNSCALARRERCEHLPARGAPPGPTADPKHGRSQPRNLDHWQRVHRRSRQLRRQRAIASDARAPEADEARGGARTNVFDHVSMRTAAAAVARLGDAAAAAAAARAVECAPRVEGVGGAAPSTCAASAASRSSRCSAACERAAATNERARLCGAERARLESGRVRERAVPLHALRTRQGVRASALLCCSSEERRSAGARSAGRGLQRRACVVRRAELRRPQRAGRGGW